MADAQDTYTAIIILQAQKAMEDFEQLRINAELYKQQIKEIQALSDKPLSAKAVGAGIVDADKVRGASTDMKALSIAMREVDKEARAAAKGTKELNTEMKNVAGGAKGVGGALSSLGSIGKFVFGSVLGITAVSALRSVIRYMQEAVQAGLEFSNALFTLSGSIKLLQNLGMEITFEDSLKLVRELKEEFGVFTTKSLVEGVSKIQLLMRNFEFTNEQMKEVARLSAALAIVQGKDVSEAAKELALFFSSGYAESLQRAGFAVNRVTVAHEAQRMGLIELGQGYQQLTEPERALAAYTLVMRQAGDLTLLATEAQDQNFGKVEKLNAAYTEIKNTLGVRFLPELAKLAEVLSRALTAIEYFIDLSTYLQIQLQSNLTSALLIAAEAANMFWNSLRGGGEGFSIDKLIEDFTKVRDALQGELMAEKFPDLFDPLKGFKGTGLANQIDENAEEIQNIIEELNREIEDEEMNAANRRKDILIDYFNDVEQLWIDHQRRMADLGVDYERDLADIETGRLQDIEDENRDYANSVAESAQESANRRTDAERKYRDQELIAELRFQERMRQLREGFLFSLEDAVRERDARQIIRLTRQYNMEREQLIREEEISKKERWLAYQRQLQDIDRQRQERMSRLYAEHVARLQEIDIQAERERERAKLEFDRKQEDEKKRYEQDKIDRKARYDDQLSELDRHLNDRITEIAKKLLEEHNVTVGMLESIYQAYKAYYGPGGYIEGVYKYYLQMLAAMPYAKGYGATPQPPPDDGQAEGGTMIATKATRVLFGEAGPEMATFTPLSRAGVNVGRTQGSIPAGMGGGAGNGKLLIQLNLDPGLQYEIVDQAMGELADVITHIERARK